MPDANPTTHSMRRPDIAVIGGGPAGLAAAEVLSAAGCSVSVYEAMPTVARKFLLAGKSGLNITHSEDLPAFLSRYGPGGTRLLPAIRRFGPAEIRAWALSLGTETFTGSSGRVFPRVMKASPLLRAWLRRLEDQGVRIHTRHRWHGFDGTGLMMETPEGSRTLHPDATVLALGGASWPRLGSDAAWVPRLLQKDVEIAPFRPANCGFDVAWSETFRERHAGAPLKGVTATSDAGTVPGEFVVSRNGIEGSLVYAHAAALRDRLEAEGRAVLTVDLAPGRSGEKIARDLARLDPKASFPTRLRKAAGLEGVKAALLRECLGEDERNHLPTLATRIKALAIPLAAPRPIAEAISSAGGVRWEAIDGNFMLKALPGLFVAGEMIDWEAPTGGYLLTACLAGGRAVGEGVLAWLAGKDPAAHR